MISLICVLLKVSVIFILLLHSTCSMMIVAVFVIIVEQVDVSIWACFKFSQAVNIASRHLGYG